MSISLSSPIYARTYLTFYRIDSDTLALVLRQCNTLSLVRCAQSCRLFRALVSAELRYRYFTLLRFFFGSHANQFDELIRSFPAIISGSVALAFLSWTDQWVPGDMDIYISNNAYNRFTGALEWTGLAVLETDTGPRSPSPYRGITRVRRYVTWIGRNLDVIQSTTCNPATPLLYFWSSVVVNFITPYGAVCVFPMNTLNHRGLVADISYSEKLVAARKKYETRGFEFAEVDVWGPISPITALGDRVLSDRPILGLNFNTVWPVDACKPPLVRECQCWIIPDDAPVDITGNVPFHLSCIAISHFTPCTPQYWSQDLTNRTHRY